MRVCFVGPVNIADLTRHGAGEGNGGRTSGVRRRRVEKEKDGIPRVWSPGTLHLSSDAVATSVLHVRGHPSIYSCACARADICTRAGCHPDVANPLSPVYLQKPTARNDFLCPRLLILPRFPRRTSFFLPPPRCLLPRRCLLQTTSRQ